MVRHNLVLRIDGADADEAQMVCAVSAPASDEEGSRVAFAGLLGLEKSASGGEEPQG